MRIRNFVPRGGFYHVARHIRSTGHSSQVHTHDFPEVFWMERGAALHLVNGQKKVVQAGDLILIRPPDVHGFSCLPRKAGREGFALVNVALPAPALEAFRARHFRVGRPWPWSGDALPARFRLGAEELRALAWLADELARGPQSRLRLEAFLGGLLLSVERGHEAAEGLPDWLRAALVAYSDPKHLGGGAPELARLAGRTREHVNRVVRKQTGRTTTEVLNEIRLAHCARELAMSGRPILELSLDAGFENLSYFYRVFRRRFGKTPRRYRLEQQRLVR